MAGSRAHPIERICLLLLGAALVCVPARSHAEEIQLGDTAIHSVSRAQFSADVTRLQGIVADCTASNDACDPAKVGDDERVGDDKAGSFEMHWGWLRSALQASHGAKPEERARLMRESGAQLSAMAREIGASTPDAGFAAERRAANDVLTTPEFDQDAGPTWWDRKRAQLAEMIYRLFDGLGELGTQAPWIGILVEWILFLGAAVGLLIVLLRTVKRQRRRIELATGAAVRAAWKREPDDWARMAEQAAAAGDWREAVHCLYWASITLLEGRRAWRHNPTRTPREYVRLLKPGSSQQQGLRRMTQIFERIWYGHRDAEAEVYAQAHACFETLDRAGSSTDATTRPDAAGVTA